MNETAREDGWTPDNAKLVKYPIARASHLGLTQSASIPPNQDFWLQGSHTWVWAVIFKQYSN